jgi:hypothetical protein
MLASSYRDGCRFLDLAPLSDPTLLPSALAVLLGVAAQSGNLVPSLVAFLQDKQILIVFDSCEHIIEATAIFAEQLLRGASGVHVLATSREPLARRAKWSGGCRRSKFPRSLVLSQVLSQPLRLSIILRLSYSSSARRPESTASL